MLSCAKKLSAYLYLSLKFKMSTAKVFIKSSGAPNLCTKNNLLAICANHSIKLVRVLPSGSDFNVFCLTVAETEKLFTEKVLASLTDCGFAPTLPPQLKSSRSVIIRKVDPHIFENSDIQIKSELEKCNKWCNVNEVIKFKNSAGSLVKNTTNNSMKIVFASSSIAEKSLSYGLSLFSLHVPSYNIIKDKFVSLIVCFMCYAVEDHILANCPKKSVNKLYKICSKCFSEGHDFKTCKITDRDFCCVNCGGNHHAMAMVCPIRREALRKKRTSETRKTSDVVKGNTLDSFQHQIDCDLIYKSFALMFLASMKNAENPGTFSTELNYLYSQNNLPTLNLEGFIPPSLSSFTKHDEIQSEIPVGSSLESKMESSYQVKSLANHKASPPLQAEKTKRSTAAKVNKVDSFPISTAKQQTTKVPLPSKQHKHNPPLEAAWDDFKVFKSWGTKADTTEELQRAWESGEIVIATEDGNVPGYNTVMSLLSRGGLPKMLSMKKDAFTEMASSPKRYFARK